MHDFKVYKIYQEIFSQPILDFIKTHNFSNPYQLKIFNSIDEAIAYDRFSSPELSFHNNELEKKRIQMIDALIAFRNKLTIETFTLDNSTTLFNVPRKPNDYDEKERTRIILEINDLSTQLSSQLEAFNKACLKKFDQKISVEGNTKR